jgi:hypothetical protein
MPLPAGNKFAPKPGAAPAAKPKPAVKPKPKPKTFGAASDQTPQIPMLTARAETYRIRHLGAEELIHPEYKTKSWRLSVEDTETGEQYITLHMNTTAGIAEYQRQVMSTAGYASAAEYNEFDPEGDFFETVIGEANAFAEAGLTLDRRLVDVVVKRGKVVIDKKTGQPKIDRLTGEPDYYRNYTWTVVPEDEQDEAPKVEAGEAS